jgi:hypothetical protein
MMGVTLIPLPGNFGICRLAPGDPLPAWAVDGLFLSVTRTVDELSIVCGEASVPEKVRCERGWRCLRVGGTLGYLIPKTHSTWVKFHAAKFCSWSHRSIASSS